MASDIEIIEFLKPTYLPEHEHIPGYLNIECLVREFGVRERERSFTFQYDRDNGKVCFLVYPALVQLPIEDAANVEQAIERAKQFLTKWLGEDAPFRLRTSQEIRQLEEKKRSARK